MGPFHVESLARREEAWTGDYMGPGAGDCRACPRAMIVSRRDGPVPWRRFWRAAEGLPDATARHISGRLRRDRLADPRSSAEARRDRGSDRGPWTDRRH